MFIYKEKKHSSADWLVSLLWMCMTSMHPYNAGRTNDWCHA